MIGQLYDVDAEAPPTIEAFVHMPGAALLARATAWHGPIAEYTLEHSRSLRW